MSHVTNTIPISTCRIDVSDQNGPPLKDEWLLTNGSGGFAMGTVCGCNTRRYHSLLIASQHPPVQRINTLNSVGESLIINNREVDLYTHEFAGGSETVFHPQGWRNLVTFKKTPSSCKWTYEVGPIRLVKKLRLIWKRQLAILDYHMEILDDTNQIIPDTVKLRLIPFISIRDFHSLRHNINSDTFTVTSNLTSMKIATQGCSSDFYMAIDRGGFIRQPDFWQNFRYRVETKSQPDDTESLFVPGFFECEFTELDKQGDVPQPLQLCFGIEDIDWQACRENKERKSQLFRQINHVCMDINDETTSERLATLTAASDDFVVTRIVNNKPYTTILAGYPWFADWGRDTMISLSGLLLCTGRYDQAKQTLLTFASHIHNGMVPNVFDDYSGAPSYNTVDASLWFIHAALEYLASTGDQDTWNDVLGDACSQIIDAYADGTDFDIHMDGDGLISAGNENTQLTWMDAKRDGITFTPRYGKAVEINALWYNAVLRCAEVMTGPKSKKYEQFAKRAKRSFTKLFWDDQLGFMLDHVCPDHKDRSLRPNQLFAVSLPNSPLPLTKQKKVIAIVKKHLLTPMGIRTLPINDPNYHGNYTGSLFERDKSYHQGTVWAWLIGPYVEGLLRANRFSKKSQQEAKQTILQMHLELSRHSLGQLHEIYDGDNPHTPRGCIAQAWSIAELLRVTIMVERRGQ